MALKSNTRNLVFGAVTAAAYVVLTLVSSSIGLAYGPVQVRLSEALCVLAALNPASIAGLTVGCMISNVFSFNLIDMVVGTAATLVAGCVSYALRKVRIFSVPILSFISPVIINAVVVGLEIAYFFVDNLTFLTFFSSALSVGAGEAVSCLLIGIPFYKIIEKRTELFKI